MPPRPSPNRGVPRRGRPSHGDNHGDANRGSQFGGPSSTPATPPGLPEIIPVNILSAIGGQPSESDNRGRGRGRGRPGRGRGARDAPGSPSSAATTESHQTNHPTTFRGQSSRNRGRGAGRGGDPGTAISPDVTAPETTSIATIPHTNRSATPVNILSAIGEHSSESDNGLGRPSSAATTETIPSQIPAEIPASPDSPQINHPTAFRGLSGNRGRGAGRGGVPGSPSITAMGPDETETTSIISISQSNPRNTFREQFVLAASNRGRGRGRGASRGGSPGTPSSVPATPNTGTASTTSFFHRGQSFPGRGGNRGGARGSPFGHSFRGGGGGGGGGGVGSGSVAGSPSGIPDHIVTFGAKRPGYGSGGRAVKVIINAFPTTVPNIIIYQYDVVVDNGKLPARLNMELFNLLQQQQATIFTPKAAYDGQKVIFSIREFLGQNNSQRFVVSRPRSNGPPKIYDIIVTKASEINSELLQRFTEQNLSHNENVSTVLAALNVAVKMEPNQVYPFNKRSFYIPDGKKDIGGGIELWRGIFQSVRPTVDRLIINIDLSTGMMYKEGPLLNLCIDFFGRAPATSPDTILAGTKIRDIERHNLQKFLSGVRVKVSTTGDRERVIRGLSREGANRLTFETHAGVQMTVAQYFQSLGRPVQYPNVICALVGKTAMVPLEFCTVPRGQFMRKEIPNDKVKDILEFSTKKPQERLQSIKDGLQYLRYGQSEYVRDFGMTIDENPLSTNARVIEPPKLKYNAASRQPTIQPKDGAWNMVDKKFYEASKIVRWAVVIYDSQRNFPKPSFIGMVNGFLNACDEVGMTVENRDPIYAFENAQNPIQVGKHLMKAVNECQKQFNQKLTLIVVILPDNAGDIYNAVKHFGDITFGIPTQCLRSFHCKKARLQYWNNVMLKVNVKLGGINVIPDPSSLAAAALTDPANPTIVMGADVAHPPPGVDRPSYSAIIGSVDSHTARYVATSRAQTGKQEIINDMQEMCEMILSQYKDYRVNKEKKKFGLERLIFYRDGVSESQFKQVLELELPMIKAACEEFGVNPKITLIIVGKRHHIQFFPMPREGDMKSNNCFAGTVVDRDVTHPTDHDFYLLSHAGILGTSRPAHYSVLYDESSFNADALQSLSYSLCHVYAPSTRAVSIPAPVYYADLVCSRAKTHFDPERYRTFDSSSVESGSTNLEAFKNEYMPLHANQQKAMYFA